MNFGAAAATTRAWREGIYKHPKKNEGKTTL